MLQECNSTELWCDMGYYNGDSCWLGNYCLQQVGWDFSFHQSTSSSLLGWLLGCSVVIILVVSRIPIRNTIRETAI